MLDFKTLLTLTLVVITLLGPTWQKFSKNKFDTQHLNSIQSGLDSTYCLIHYK